MLNYEKLMLMNPTSYGKMTNSIEQEIEFFEHPTRGDEAFVIIVSHDLKLADYSDFMDIDDMTAEHREYEPAFINGKACIGGYELT